MVSAAAFVEDVETDPIIIVDGLTKNWRYPGWRISWTLGPKAVIETIASAGSFLDGGANHPFQNVAAALLNPALIMVLGSVAAKKLLGVRSVNEARGRVIEHDNRKYLVGYHPAASFYRDDIAENVRQDFLLLQQELQKL